MNTAPGNMHDWREEHESAKAVAIQDAISDRIQDLEMSSGHGDAEQKLMERVLDTLFESDIATETFRRYLFEIWRRRNAQDEEDKKKMARAAQIIANLLALPIRSIVASDIHKEFGA